MVIGPTLLSGHYGCPSCETPIRGDDMGDLSQGDFGERGDGALRRGLVATGEKRDRFIFRPYFPSLSPPQSTPARKITTHDHRNCERERLGKLVDPDQLSTVTNSIAQATAVRVCLQPGRPSAHGIRHSRGRQAPERRRQANAARGWVELCQLRVNPLERSG